MNRGRVVAVLLLVAAGLAGAQEPPTRPARPDTGQRPTTAIPRAPTPAPRTPGDTIPGRAVPRDTVAADTSRAELVDWAPPDSAMQALLLRGGFAITRYQGAEVVFEVGSRRITLIGTPAAVQQGDALVVGDTIIYNDETGDVIVRRGSSGQVVLRDPAQGEDVVANSLIYNMRTSRGVVLDVATVVESGERWYVSARRAGLLGASPERATRFYGHDGAITSCDLTEPHYHFEARNLKLIQNRLMVARPAVLYIGNVPVMWFPFVFQDMRQGRRSGFLSPRLGVAELIRNNPGYRRSVDNIGYYFALNDYLDASTWLDWRSGARGTAFDPGYLRYNAELNYNWLSRFLRGSIGAGYDARRDGQRNLQLAWRHDQQFSQRTSFNTNLQYVQNTTTQRLDAIAPAAALATISSRANFQHARGPFRFSLGATANQYTGRPDSDLSFPTLNITTEPIGVGGWLTWSPTLSLTNQQRLNNVVPGDLGLQFGPTPGDTARLTFNQRTTSLSVQSPLRIRGFNLANSFIVRDVESNAPTRAVVYDPDQPGDSTVRIFARSFVQSVDWTPSFSLPQFLGGTWNVSPSVSFTNVEPGQAFLVRSYLGGPEWVNQPKRPTYSLSTAPTLYRRFPGIGPFSALRHGISPVVTYTYAPEATVGNEFLQAIGQNPGTYIGALAQSGLSLGFNSTIEARWRTERDTIPAQTFGGSDKIRLLSANFSSLTYDFIRADTLGRGLVTETFNVRLASDLLPGFDLGLDYSLFNGPSSDIRSEFRPFRSGVNATFSVNRETSAIVALSRLFGGARAERDPLRAGGVSTEPDTTAEEQYARLPVAGARGRVPIEVIPRGQGWRATLNYSARRTRPDLIGTVIDFDPASLCDVRLLDPVQYQFCVEQQRLNPRTPDIAPDAGGRTIIRTPPQSSLGGQTTFDLTEHWGASWSTNYDFERGEFASHQIALQRDLHDWRATFAFSQSPNGNFAFSFFIALKAAPELKFDYDRRSYRGAAF